MEFTYLFIVIVLFILAISDLIVGVGNDAVNFINSAVGSKVTSRKWILVIASLGIFIGATFSSGMMEIARKGIFNPGGFTFEEVMIVFVAVMLTDIILLDFFNTLGLPTSTTVSIVFELLGAAVMVAALKIFNAAEGLSALPDYINTSSALAIISGILLSVVVAFTVGAIVQYVSRLLFTFDYQRRLTWVGSVWSGFAITAMTYFLLVKGVKGASFMTPENIALIQQHALGIMLVSFVFWSLVMFFLRKLAGVNTLKIVVLLGTFSLAMAFAGNDLVNFIGVPIAGYESFLAWGKTDLTASTMYMDALAAPVKTPTYLLIIAGGIMVVTLWTSKKTRYVSDTEVKLARQGEGSERFAPSLLSRALVRTAMTVGGAIQQVVPDSWWRQSEKSFDATQYKAQIGGPLFDLVRASVNLTVASILIAFATSLGLPLSTTYVSFMVAMGTSLSDRAWGRDSAVYRVSGVISVITGWFATALVAFTVAGTFALLIYFTGIYGIIGLLAFAIFLLVRTYMYHRIKRKERAAAEALEQNHQTYNKDSLIIATLDDVKQSLSVAGETFTMLINGLLKENRKLLSKSQKRSRKLFKAHEAFKAQLYSTLHNLESQDIEVARTYVHIFHLKQDMLQSLDLLAEQSVDHVENAHNPLQDSQVVELSRLTQEVGAYLDRIQHALPIKEEGDYEKALQEKRELLAKVEEAIVAQVQGIKEKQFNSRNSQLYFTVLLEMKDIVAITARFVKVYYRT